MKYKVLHKKEHPLITGGVPFCAIIRNGKNGGFFMYKVVIIDDESIIVEGLSRLLPWKNITAGLQPQPATEKTGCP